MSLRQRLTNLGLRQKLIASLSLVLIASLIVTVLAFRATSGSQHAIEWVNHSQSVIQQTTDLQATIFGMQGSFRGYMLTGDQTFVDDQITDRNNFRIYLSSLKRETLDNPEQQEQWNRIDELVKTWQAEVVQPGFDLRDQVNAGEAPVEIAHNWVVDATTQATFSQIDAEVSAALINEQQLLVDRIDTVEAEGNRVRQILVGGAIAVGLISLATAYTISNDVARAMKRLTYVAGRVADGDYEQRVNLERGDEIGRTAAAFDVMTRKLDATVTDLNNVAEQARQGESHTRAILDNISEGIFTFTSSGIIDGVNPAAESMFQFSRDSLIGLPIGTVMTIGTPDTDPNANSTPNGHDGKRSIHQDALGHRADGTSFPIELVITEMDVPGAPRFIAVARNVSDIVEADRRLRRRNRELENLRSSSRAMLNAAGEALILISPQHTITRINRRFSEFFGVREDDVIGQPMKTYGTLLDRIFVDPDRFREVLYATIDDPEARHVSTITQQWPEARELEYFTTPVSTPDGEHLGRLFAFRDVTHEREVDRMKTEFVSLVSHELRTPLTSIKGYVDLLLEEEVGDLLPEQKEFLEIVGNNADRLVALIGDLLDISRIEAGRVELNITANDLEYVLSGLAMSFRPQFEGKRQTLNVVIPPDAPSVAADTARLNQILTNLLSNAHKYSPAGSNIEVRVGHMGDRVSVAVRDSGVGLTAEEKGRLFTRFYRARNRATEEAGGTGLGLAITRSLVELHGGTISVESEPGKGSVFTVVLPASAPAPAAESEDAIDVVPEQPAIDQTSSLRILIIEDEPDIASLMRRYLERAGFQVMTAGNAHNALQLVQRMPFDLITLDVMLPDKDGFAVLEALKADPETCDIPVMMLSMLPDEGEGKRLGAVDYLVKPVREHVLVNHISAVLRESMTPARGSILVADDDDDIRNLISQNLTRAGYTVLTARNGAEVIEIVEREKIDLILLDVRMPVMDGIEALRHLREQESTRNQSIVMMTASPGTIDEIQPVLTQLGVSDLLQKPLTAKQLAQAIQRSFRDIVGGEAS